MPEDHRFRRIAPRPERPHMPFSTDGRRGPLLRPGFVGALVWATIAGCAVAAALTVLMSGVHAP